MRDRLVREGVVTAEDVAALRKRGIGAAVRSFRRGAAERTERFEVQELSAVPDDEIADHSARARRWTRQRSSAWWTASRRSPRISTCIRSCTASSRSAEKRLKRAGPSIGRIGETLAFGSLVLEGTPVRLSGQDSGRGTFSQRHLTFYDAETGRKYMPLQHLAPDQARFDVFDSPLSEYAVMGFEFGYSVADPLTLVLWEAQFGDFANGAQIMIDQFIASAEAKWGQPSGLVLLLPHGYEGQGPEHSSARIERFLTLCAENNMQVANCTTPAQYFHLLRRQMRGGADRRGMRKPLVIFTPKRLLRHPRATSTFDDLSGGGFREVLDETANVDTGRVQRMVFCSGQIYYDLVAAREEQKADHVAIVRLEQLYPLAAGAGSRHPAAVSAHLRSGLGAGGAAQHGRLALHGGTDAANARCDAAGTALCGPAGERQPVDRLAQTASGGAGGNRA